MYFHEIAEELKIYMAPSERGGIFVVQLIGDTLRAPMTEEEEKMALDDKFNPLANGMSLNMQDQIFEGKSLYQGIELGSFVVDMTGPILQRKSIISMMQIRTICKCS